MREVPTDKLSFVKGATDGSRRSVTPEVTVGEERWGLFLTLEARAG